VLDNERTLVDTICRQFDGHDPDTSEESMKLTDKIVKRLPAPAKGYKITYDSDVAGFGCRVTAAGARAFVLNYTTRSGAERRYTLGRFPDWQTTAARAEAARLKREIRANGLDPVGELQAERAAPTMADLCKKYLEEHATKKRTGEDDERQFRTHVLPAMQHKKVSEVSFADIDSLHRKLSKTTPTRANRVLALLSKAFSLAERWEWRASGTNPAKHVLRNDENRRERYLTPMELERLTAALAKHPDRDAADAIRLLLLTGARRGEVLGATWGQFDLANGTWTKPSSHTKQRKLHHIPLAPPALQLLAELRERSASEYLFPARNGKPRINLNNAWATVSKAARLDGVRLHDLRHSFASILVASGASLPMIGRLLGHTQTSTTARYAHLAVDPLRELVNRVGAVVEGVGKDGAEVIPMKKGRA
jgi:integrase